ncbi:homoserine O-acetyltransferase [Opitutales bacterium ASA1]|uniref:homoserine O-acetyltransferase MetX n=1 Tax=Congregicoccus parvus TaxID=3081749 RepID=UPI002B30A79C|nr:homoserine O-acetyltransferase [Opitutales bacterium ASA1]
MNESLETDLCDQPGEVGLVEPHDFVCREPFTFDCGRTIPGFTLRYETYGRLNERRDNAVFVFHALSGDHHAAGIHGLADRKPGWWNNLIGPGKAVDTTRYFVVCSNCLGGCQGSTGPMSIDPETGRNYGMGFPAVTIRDMVRADKRLLDHLGVRSVHAAIGGSMGGMRVLQFGIEYPDFVQRLLPMATTARESAQAIAFNAVGREAIMQDPGWHDGDYPNGGGPHVGLAIARMMAHITYLSDESMDRKFGRRRRAAVSAGAPASTAEAAASAAVAAARVANDEREGQFEVESYLQYQGRSFINRFDANTYLYITRALDNFDLAGAYGSLEQAFAGLRSRTLCVAFTSDWLFPAEQNRAIVLAMLRAGKQASYAELETDLGHDSFLLESPAIYDLVRSFLAAG